MLLRWLSNDSKYTLLCVALSVPPLLMSLFGWGAFLPVDPAWAAILLCGVPILFGAGRGLIFDHDIKADVLVSLALLASLAVGEYSGQAIQYKCQRFGFGTVSAVGVGLFYSGYVVVD